MQVFYYLPALIGIVLILLGAFHGWKLRATIRRCTIPAEGRLEGFKPVTRKGGTLYYPVVTFRADGETIRATYAFGKGEGEWPMVAGDMVSLRYNPERPSDIYIYHEQSVWREYASPVCIIVGGLLFIGAYYYIL